MIFVTIGSAEPFDRLMAALSGLGSRTPLVVQHGGSPPPSSAARSVPFMSFDECMAHIRQAHAVITHAGVGTVLAVLSHGKRPIVVPRLRAFGEAVDDHQLLFARRLADAGVVVLVEDLTLLADAVAEAESDRKVLTLSANELVADLREYIRGAGPKTRHRSTVLSRSRHSLGSCFQGALRLLPPSKRAPVARRLLRSAPRAARLSLAGRAIRVLHAQDDLHIVSGPLEGCRWVVASGLHACVEGTYEAENQALLCEHVAPGEVVFDVGANAGFFTLLASRLVGPSGRVIAFEPFPAALHDLRRHLELNGVENADVIEAAVSESPGTARFLPHVESTMGRLAAEGELVVEVVALDDVCRSGRVPMPDLIKIDVEGEELKVLRGAEAILRERRPLIVLATHGADVHRSCCELLRELGYRLEQLPYDTTVSEFDFLGEVAAIPNYEVAGVGLS